jgi:hypothetical protein
MNPQAPQPAPDGEATFTLYRFCRSRRLALSDQERSAQGIELSKIARQRQLTFPTVREQVGRFRIRARLYPESFLNEWLARYTEAQAKATAAPEETPKPPARSQRLTPEISRLAPGAPQGPG